MQSGRETIFVVLGAVVATLLQIVVAPCIAILSAMPNFMLVYVMVLSVVRCDRFSIVLAFVLGLLFDLVGGGPVGVMAFLFVLISYVAAHAFFALNNDTLFMPLFMVALAVFATELLYGGFQLAMGYDASLLQALVYRCIPCGLYDCVVGVLLYPLTVRLFARNVQTQPGTARLL